MKKIICSCICIILLLTSIVYSANATDSLKIYNNPGSNPLNFGDLEPFIDGAGRTLIPAIYIYNVFQGGISYTVENNITTITQKGFEYTTVLKLTVGSNILYKNGTEIVMDTTPVCINNQIYIPLRAVGEALEHAISWNENLYEINVIYHSVDIYMWNENEDSSDAGLRYAIFQGALEERELPKIKEKAVTDFGEIKALFDKVPRGDIHLCVLYKLKGHKVSYEKMEETQEVIIERFGYKCGVSDRLIDKALPIIQGTGEYSDKWYSKQLMSLDEGSLWDSLGHTYRFTCIRSFDAPFSIRIDVLANGKGELSFAMCEQPIGAYGGELTKTVKHKLSKKQVDTLLQAINKNDFWNLPTSIDDSGLDGSIWLVEGVNNGKYHIVERWTPNEGSIYELGNLFIKLYGIEISDLY